MYLYRINTLIDEQPRIFEVAEIDYIAAKKAILTFVRNRDHNSSKFEFVSYDCLGETQLYSGNITEL